MVYANRQTDIRHVCVHCSPASVGLAQARPNYFYRIVEPNKCHIVRRFITVAYGVQKNSLNCVHLLADLKLETKTVSTHGVCSRNKGIPTGKTNTKGNLGLHCTLICQPFLLEISTDM